MSGIAKLKNRVTVGGDSEPYGGQVVDLQYSVSFEGTSSLSITVANNDGVYDDPDLNSTVPVKIDFGICTFMMLPISFKKSKGGSKGRTMSVIFEDMGLKHLDKNVILLKNQHLANDNLTPCTIVVGKNFTPNAKGVLTRWFGGWKPQGVAVLYDIRDLAIAIDEHGIPISDRFYQFLRQFKGYEEVGDDGEVCGIQSFLRGETGVLRNVVSTMCGELGVIPFWNNEDAIGGSPLSARASIRNAEADGSGFLDFINLENDIDKDNIEATVKTLLTSCNVEDDSYEVSIKNSFLKGGIGAFSVNPTQVFTGRSNFRRIRFQEKVEGIKIAGNYELSLLMRAAMLGPEFYKKYVLQKLTASYMKDLETQIFQSLFDRDQSDSKDPEIFDFVDLPAREEAGKEFPFNIVINEMVDDLYKDEDFSLLPVGYSTEFDWTVHDDKDALTVAGNIPLDAKSKHVGTDSKYYNVTKNEAFMSELREDSEFVAVMGKITETLATFLENPGDDPIYQEMVFLAENYARWWYGKLLTGKSSAARSYPEAVQAYFSDLAVTETPLAAIYKKYKSPDEPVSEKRLWDTGTYYMNWGGTAECGYKILPDNTVVLPDRNLDIKDAYQHIIGIRTYVNKGANASPERTTCSDGLREREIPTKRTIDTGENGAFKFETYSIRTDKDLDLEQECVEEQGSQCIMVGESIIPGLGKSITSAQYSQANFRRTNCNRTDNIARTPSTKCNPDSQNITYALPTDNDFMVPIHDATSADAGGIGNADTDMAFAVWNKSNSLTDTESYWNNHRQLMALEVVADEVERNYKTSWGRKDLDYWDLQLMTEVQPPTDTQRVFSSKNLYYTYNFAELLQGLRCAYIPNSDLSKVAQIEVEDVPFDIGQLVNILPFPFEYEVCDDRAFLNLPEAEANLIRIMTNYIEANISPALSRDFVISGFGFKDSLDADPSLPTIHEGLESISISFGGNGIHTSIKMGNKRRARFSAEVRKQLIARGLAGGSASTMIPNNVSNSFSLGLRTKM